MSLTVQIMIAVAIFLAAYDVYIIYSKGKFYSISAYIIRGSKKMPLVVLAFGILLGHLFWSMNTFDYATKEYLIEKCKAVLNE